jgi:hypothetical protein
MCKDAANVLIRACTVFTFASINTYVRINFEVHIYMRMCVVIVVHMSVYICMSGSEIKTIDTHPYLHTVL